MELVNNIKTRAELSKLRNQVEEKPYKINVKLIDGSLKSANYSTYLQCLQVISDFDSRSVNYAKLIEPDGTINIIDADELQLWRNHREHYRVEVKYCNHDKDNWIAYPHLLVGLDNAMMYQPGDFFERIRIRRVYDGKIVHEEGSRIYKLIYSDGHYDFVTNCSYRMAESIGLSRCRKNGTDYNKMSITEGRRKVKLHK